MPLFTRSPLNPILTPSDHWWESRSVLNPGAVLYQGRVALVYRAVGADGLSRFGLAWSSDGEQVDIKLSLPFYEAPLDDPLARLSARARDIARTTKKSGYPAIFHSMHGIT